VRKYLILFFILAFWLYVFTYTDDYKLLGEFVGA